MTWVWIITFFAVLALLTVAIKKEWNGFLLFCNIVLFLPAFCLTMLLLFQRATEGTITHPILFFISILVSLVSFIGIFKVLFRSRCPQCKKFFSARKTGEEQIQAGDIYYKNENNTEVAYQKNLYRRDYICKHCSHEWSCNISREEKA